MKGLLILMMVLASASAWAQTDLKVGTTPGSITSSAVFEAASTSKGLLIPRMTTAQMNAIASPTLGLMVFNTDLNCLHFYFSGWKSQCDPANLGAWALLGNAGTVDGTNFIGTTDNVPLSIRVNNIRAGRLASNGETILGYQSGNNVSAAVNSTFIGYQSGFTTTTQGGNTFIGSQAGYGNTTGDGLAFLGYQAGYANTTGTNSTFIGYRAGAAHTTAINSTFLGYRAGEANTTASFNTYLGSFAGNLNTTGNSNLFVGTESGRNNITGNSNIFLGYQTGMTNTTGSSNTLLGYQANVASAALTNAAAIGANASVGASNSLVLGGTGANAVNVGINTTTPQYKLDIDAMTGSAGNPLRLQGLNIGANTDSMVTTLNGVVRQIPVSLLTTRLRNDFWAKIGNGGTDPNNEFVGTTDNVGLAVRTNNTERMRINEVGNVGVNTATPNSTVQVNGSFSTALTTKTAAYTATNADHIIIGNATTAAFTLTLPTAVGITGRQYIIKKTDASVNAVTVATTGGQTIDGAATITISVQWQTKTFVSDGTNWLIISNQ